jgi:hypothetical protein
LIPIVTKLLLLVSFLGSTAQLRPWPPPQNPAEFLGGFSPFSVYFCHHNTAKLKKYETITFYISEGKAAGA